MRRRETVVRVVVVFGRASVALLGSLALIGVHASGAHGMPAAPGAAPTVLVVGDSLAVGTEPFLGQLLDQRDLRWDARSGRTTPQGLLALRADLRNLTPQTVVVSLGTNDGSSPQRFASRARRLLRAVPPTAAWSGRPSSALPATALIAGSTACCATSCAATTTSPSPPGITPSAAAGSSCPTASIPTPQGFNTGVA
jgi:hypothetical protein